MKLLTEKEEQLLIEFYYSYYKELNMKIENKDIKDIEQIKHKYTYLDLGNILIVNVYIYNSINHYFIINFNDFNFQIYNIEVYFQNAQQHNITDNWIKFLRKKKLEKLQRNGTN